MNGPNFFSVVNYALSKAVFEKYGYFFLVFVAVSCLTSLLNPLIIVFLNEDLKKYIGSMIFKRTKSNPVTYANYTVHMVAGETQGAGSIKGIDSDYLTVCGSTGQTIAMASSDV